MKAGRVLIIAVFLILTLGNTKVKAQTVAVGRVFAEVVESVSASSATNTNFELSRSTDAVSASVSSKSLNLGAITITTGKDITCNIVLTPASLKNGEGHSFTIDPAVKNEMPSAPASSSGVQTIQLGATPAIPYDQAIGNYEGSYTVIFAYN